MLKRDAKYSDISKSMKKKIMALLRNALEQILQKRIQGLHLEMQKRRHNTSTKKRYNVRKLCANVIGSRKLIITAYVISLLDETLVAFWMQRAMQLIRRTAFWLFVGGHIVGPYSPSSDSSSSSVFKACPYFLCAKPSGSYMTNSRSFDIINLCGANMITYT